MNNGKTIGENIRRLRELRGWSQVQLAELSGMAGPTINRIENGVRTPRSDTLSKIAIALDVSLDDLTSKTGEVKQHEKNLEAELLAEFRTAENKEEIIALVRAYKRVRIERIRATT